MQWSGLFQLDFFNRYIYCREDDIKERYLAHGAERSEVCDRFQFLADLLSQSQTGPQENYVPAQMGFTERHNFYLEH